MVMLGAINPMVFLVLAIVVVLAISFVATGKRRQQVYAFTGCPLMSASEIRFLRVLQMAAPNELVFSQVNMAALVRPNYAAADPRYLPAFRSMSQKRIDFVVCNRDSLEVRCLVELDDSSHDTRRDQARDAITAQAGYRTVRVRAGRRYDIDGLRRQVFQLPAEQPRFSG
jgi:Protein of unknown function (DUF2726)